MRNFIRNVSSMLKGGPVRIDAEGVALAAEKFVLPLGYRRVTKKKSKNIVFAKQIETGYICNVLYVDNLYGEISCSFYYKNDDIYVIESEKLINQVKPWDRALFFGNPRSFPKNNNIKSIKYSIFKPLDMQLSFFYNNISETSANYENFCSDIDSVYFQFKHNTALAQSILGTTRSRLTLAIAIAVYTQKVDDIVSIIGLYRESNHNQRDLNFALAGAQELLINLQERKLIDSDALEIIF